MSIQKRLVSRSRSPLPIRRIPYQNKIYDNIPQPPQTSLRKTIKVIQNIQNDGIVQQLKTNRDNLCTCFDIFQLLYENNVPQRCIEHNNFVTLYCQQQQKLLCVNCIYGTVNHKSHKVIPIKNALEKIVQDNKTMNQKVLSEIEKLKNVQKVVLQNLGKNQQGMKSILQSLELQFQQIKNIINQKYNGFRNAIIDSFTQNQAKSDIIIKEISWLKNCYIQKQKNQPKTADQASSLYNHIVLSALLSHQILQPNMFKPIKIQQLQNQTVGNLAKIRQQLQGPKDKQKIKSKRNYF